MHEVKLLSNLKSDGIVFLKKLSFWDFRPKLGFSSFMKSYGEKIFPSSYCNITPKIELIYFSGKILILRFSGKKWPKWAKNEVFSILWKLNTQSYLDFLNQITVAKVFGFLG